MDKKLIIAIDGYSSCGKSTFAKAIARELKYLYIDSGAMYRAVTLYSMRRNVTFNGDFRISNKYLRNSKNQFLLMKNCY